MHGTVRDTSELKRNRVVPQNLEKFLKCKRNDDNKNTDSQPEKLSFTTSQLPARGNWERQFIRCAAGGNELYCTIRFIDKIARANHGHASCSSSSSDMAHAKKDRRVAIVEQQQLERPVFYYCIVEKGLFCKNCVIFSERSSPGVPYVTKAGIFGNHRSRGNMGHLESERPKTKKSCQKQSYDTIVGKGSHTPFSKIPPFLEIQDVPTFYRPIGKTKVLNDYFDWFVYKFYPKRILILEEYLLKWWNANLT